MATGSKKRERAKASKGARPARPAAQTTIGSRIDQLADLQRDAIGRYADLVSSATVRLAAGDFNLRGWLTDYSAIWSDCADDLSKVTKVMLQAPSEQAPKSAEQQGSPGRGAATYRNWLALQQSFLSRVADYYRGVGQLVAAGSMEPREWVQGGADFWSDVLADISDWVHRESGDQLRPTAQWMPRLRQQVRQGKLVTRIGIDVPMEAFPADNGDEIELFTEGLSRVGGGVTLKPKHNVSLVPAKVRRSSAYSELKLYDLPASLVPGEVYAGLVWAKETKLPVASVEVQIV